MATGPGDILALIRHGLADTRGDVLEATGLSRMTVAARLDALMAAGMVVEGETTGATGGRRRRSLVFNTDQARVLAVAVDTTHTRIAVTDLGGDMLADAELDVAVESGPSEVLDRIATAVTGLLDEQGLRHDDLCGVGLSLPGPIDPESGRPSQPPILPGWDGYPVAAHLEAVLPGVPVLTANDADAAALGEYAAGHAGVRSLCLVKVSTGIGVGIVIDGRSYTGLDGGAGDIGHVRVSPRSEERCHCGARGCLAAVASGRAVARSLREAGLPAGSALEVGELLRSGDVDAARLTQQAGRRIGEVMAGAVCLLNPGVVLVGGALASASLLAGIRETLYKLALPRATRHMTLQLGQLGDDAEIRGLARLVVDTEYSVDAVNRTVRG